MAPNATPPANATVASRFRRLAELLDIEERNPHRARAYRRAADTVERLPGDVSSLLAADDGLARLDALPGIGPDLAGKIAEVCRTGALAALDAAEARLPVGVVRLSALPGLGPERVRRLRTELGVGSPEELGQAIAAGALSRLEGFGPRLQRRLTAAVSKDQPMRWPRAFAAPQAAELLRAVRSLPGVETAEIAGSLRRGRPDVGDIDLVAAAHPGAPVTETFAALPQVAEVLACGPTRATVRLASGLQADLLVVAPESYGAALLHFTGSKPHNISLRRRAKALGLKLNERGLFRGTRRIAGLTEAEVYAALGLRTPPPHLREYPAPPTAAPPEP